jgi:hypothetical protein
LKFAKRSPSEQQRARRHTQSPRRYASIGILLRGTGEWVLKARHSLNACDGNLDIATCRADSTKGHPGTSLY